MRAPADTAASRRQFASIDGEFLEWQFRILGRHQNPLAAIDRNVSGFAREIFTDAGTYAIHFLRPVVREDTASVTAEDPGTLAARPSRRAAEPHVRPLRGDASDVRPCAEVTQIARPATNAEFVPLAERAVVLACSVAIDVDYFSRHAGVGSVPGARARRGAG